MHQQLPARFEWITVVLAPIQRTPLRMSCHLYLFAGRYFNGCWQACQFLPVATMAYPFAPMPSNQSGLVLGFRCRRAAYLLCRF